MAHSLRERVYSLRRKPDGYMAMRGYRSEKFFSRYTYRPMKNSLVLRSLVACGLMSLAMAVAFQYSHAATASGPSLLVANQGDHDLSIIDLAAGKQIATV